MIGKCEYCGTLFGCDEKWCERCGAPLPLTAGAYSPQYQYVPYYPPDTGGYPPYSSNVCGSSNTAHTYTNYNGGTISWRF